MGETVTVTGTWPDSATEALVVWRRDRYPEDPNEQADGRRVFSRAEYEQRRGALEVNTPAAGRHYFTTFLRVGKDFGFAGRAMESMDVTYRVRTKRNLLRTAILEAWIDLRSGGDLQDLPPVRAVMAGSFPLHPGDGRTLKKPARVAFFNRAARIELPCDGLSGFVRLFFDDDRHAREYRLLGTPEKLRVK
jgi:hypothetical protein